MGFSVITGEGGGVEALLQNEFVPCPVGCQIIHTKTGINVSSSFNGLDQFTHLSLTAKLRIISPSLVLCVCEILDYVNVLIHKNSSTECLLLTLK